MFCECHDQVMGEIYTSVAEDLAEVSKPHRVDFMETRRRLLDYGGHAPHAATPTPSAGSEPAVHGRLSDPEHPPEDRPTKATVSVEGAQGLPDPAQVQDPLVGGAEDP
eukprot:2531656-Pyramimonas_sp.AAC.2